MPNLSKSALSEAVRILTCVTSGSMVTGYTAFSSIISQTRVLPYRESRAGSCLPAASHARSPVYLNTGPSLPEKRMACPLTDEARSPERSNATRSLPVPAGRVDRVIPCSISLSPFRYHSVYSPRLIVSSRPSAPVTPRSAGKVRSSLPIPASCIPNEPSVHERVTPPDPVVLIIMRWP